MRSDSSLVVKFRKVELLFSSLSPPSLLPSVYLLLIPGTPSLLSPSRLLGNAVTPQDFRFSRVDQRRSGTETRVPSADTGTALLQKTRYAASSFYLREKLLQSLCACICISNLDVGKQGAEFNKTALWEVGYRSFKMIY